jgi:hypothetical protein
MIGYVTLGTNDLRKAAAFYDKIAAELGIARFMESDSRRLAGAAESELSRWRHAHFIPTAL